MMLPRLAALLTKESHNLRQLEKDEDLEGQTVYPARPPCEDLGPRPWGKVQLLPDMVSSQLFLKKDGGERGRGKR